MEKLYEKLKKYTLKDALEIEKSDLQYKALQKLFSEIEDEILFYKLILANSIICYQLSSTGEKYWQEFAETGGKYFKKNCNGKSENILNFFKEFLPNSKGNKRFVNVKISRLNKISSFLENLEKNDLANFVNLSEILANILNQKSNAKTIVFSIKMLWYGLNITYDFGKNDTKPNPNLLNQIPIPIDSRLTKIFEIYKEDYTDIKIFYRDLSLKLEIPEINLDAIIWVNYEKLIG